MDVSCFKEGTKPTSRPWSRHITTHVDLTCSSLGFERLAQVVTPVLGDRHGPRGEGQSACARDTAICYCGGQQFCRREVAPARLTSVAGQDQAGPATEPTCPGAGDGDRSPCQVEPAP